MSITLDGVCITTYQAAEYNHEKSGPTEGQAAFHEVKEGSTPAAVDRGGGRGGQAARIVGGSHNSAANRTARNRRCDE